MPRLSNIKTLWIGFSFLALSLSSLSLAALDCKNASLLTSLYLQAHASQHKFDDAMVDHTLKNFIKAWDPGKVYFLKGDVDTIMQQSKGLAGMIAKADCSAIDSIFAKYSQRFEETYKLVKTLIEVKHNFKLPEFINFDRKSIDYAVDMAELKDRWRKRIKLQHKQLLATIKNEAKVRAKLHKRYDLQLKHHRETNSTEVYETFVNAFSTGLDPHSEFFPPAQVEEFNIHTRLYLEGIGAILRSEDGITSIHGLVPGGSAQKSGQIKVGDKIVAVAQAMEAPVDVIDMDLKDVVKLIRGPRGTKVRVSIRRDREEFVATLTREKVDLPDQAAKSRIYEVRSETPKVQAGQASASVVTSYKIGVIDLPSFYMDFEARSAKQKDFRSSTHDVAIELKKLQAEKVDAVILDIRSNGGGALDEAVDLAGLFVGSGPIVQVKKGNDKPYVHKFDGQAGYDGPMLLMINQQSASSSEILAGAIQDYERGVIIGGAHTFGKGTVQIVDHLDPSLGAIKVTMSKFYRASGGSTQMRGVESDLTLPSVAELYEIGEKFYDYALPWDEVAPQEHRNFKMVKSYIPALKAANDTRVKADPEFKKVFDGMKEYKEKEKEHYLVSLQIDPKKKEAKDSSDASDDEDLMSSGLPKLIDDLHLQETLRVAGDYVRLLKKEPLLAWELPDLDKEKKEKQVAEQAKKEKAANAKTKKAKAAVKK